MRYVIQARQRGAIAGAIFGLLFIAGVSLAAEDFGGYKGVKQGGVFSQHISFVGDAGILLQDGTMLKTVDDIGGGPGCDSVTTDVTAQRAKGSAYQNTTAFPQLNIVSVYANDNNGGWHFMVDGSNPPTTVVATAANVIGFPVPTSIVVPPGQWIKFVDDSNAGSILQKWILTTCITGGSGRGSASKMVEVTNATITTERTLSTCTWPGGVPSCDSYVYQNGPNWRFVSASDCASTSGVGFSLLVGATSSTPTTLAVNQRASGEPWIQISGWVAPGLYYRIGTANPATCDRPNSRWTEQDLTVVGSSPAYAYAVATGTGDTLYLSIPQNTWTTVPFSSTTVAKGITVSGSNITFSRKGVYKFQLGFRWNIPTGSDVWNGMRLYDGTNTVAVSNGFGNEVGGSTGVTEQSPFLIADITDTALTYQLQIARNNGGNTATIYYPNINIGGTPYTLPAVALAITAVDSSTDGTAGNIVAWGKFSTGATPVKDAGSSNISISGTGGAYTLTFSPPLADANYSVSGSCRGTSASWSCVMAESHDSPIRTASQFKIYTLKLNSANPGAPVDFENLSIQVVR